tara:strand:- start:15 stop:482 length:468 start_codon:yes stop_codon:yes gene_type:complete
MVQYLLERFGAGGDRESAMNLFRGARLWNPHYLKKEKMKVKDCRELIDKVFDNYNCITEDMRAGLRRELQSYRNDCTRVTSTVNDVLVWHWEHRHVRPTFYEVAKLLVLVQPHSAAAERVFSLVKNRFDPSIGESTTLASWIRLSCMLKWNKRDV